MTVVIDVQALQSPEHAGRGIARYVRETVAVLVRAPGAYVEAFITNPDRPPAEDPALSSRMCPSDRFTPERASIYHAMSPFEDVGIDRMWPSWARRRMHLVVTLYDLIPLQYADHYLRSAPARRWYGIRAELARRADLVLAISEATAHDAVQLLGIRAERVRVVGAAASSMFQPPSDRADAVAAAVREVQGLRPGFVLYTGGTDYRKNIGGLLDAYAVLPRELRRSHQLVVVCGLLPSDRESLEQRAAALGISDDVLLTGKVADDQLVHLYQATELFVFPSLYEGFGLPVAEARACGAPVICSRAGALTEIVSNDEACFDPTDTSSITTALADALGSPQRRAHLRALPYRSMSWFDVASATVDAYRELEHPPARSRRRRVAMVSPVPPATTGIATYTARLVPELARRMSVDVFFDGLADRSPDTGLSTYPVECLDLLERYRAGYDHIVYAIGNQTFHASAIESLARRPGVVVAHDVRLIGLYAWMAVHRPDLAPGGFAATLARMYDGRLPPDLGARGFIDHAEADAHGVFMARDVIALSTLYLTHSETAAEWARRDARPADRHKVGVLPFGIPEFEVERSETPGFISSFGVVDHIKQSDLVIEAFAATAASHELDLALVGPVNPDYAADLRAIAARHHVQDRVTITGSVEDETYRAWLGRTAVAVQLRAASNGESSAAVADCVAAAIPTIVTDLGAARDMPLDAVVRVPPTVAASDLGSVLVKLLEDEPRRQDLVAGARRWARRNTFAAAADQLRDRLLGVPLAHV